MTCGTTTSEAFSHFITTSTAKRYQPVTEPVLTIGVDRVKAIIKRKSFSVSGGTTGTVDFKLAIQLYDVRGNNPSAWQEVGSAYSGAGEDATALIDLTQVAGYTSTFMIRFGYSYTLTGDRTMGQGDVSLQVAYDSCGSVLKSVTVALEANSTENRFVPIGVFVPAIFAEKVKAAIIVANRSGNFECRLTFRTAPTSIEVNQSAWSTTIDAWHNANGEYNTGDITISTTDFWVQLGILYHVSAGTALGSAVVTIAVCVRKA